MPQIAQLAETWSSQVFWLLLIFGLVFFVVGRGMVPRVLGTVDLRDRQIAGDLAAARAARDAADVAEADFRARENANRANAHAMVSAAKGKAQAATEAKLAEVQVGIDATLSDAEARIAASRAAAATEIETVAAEAAQDIAQRLAGISVTPDVARGAVQKVLAHV